MLLKQDTLKGIRSGAISLAFRRWRRPTVKAGGTLLTPIGQLAIEAVDVVNPAKITSAEAVAAGFLDRATLRAELSKRTGGEVYRIRFSLAGEDPRLALRRAVAKGSARDELLSRLERMAARQGDRGPTEILSLIGQHPGVRAGDLAEDVGMPRDLFKRRVRSLKELGLTESLEVGYRLSPRGAAILGQLLGRK